MPGDKAEEKEERAEDERKGKGETCRGQGELETPTIIFVMRIFLFL